MKLALLALLLASACYVDRPVVVEHVKWHNMPVPCMVGDPPAPPKDTWCNDWKEVGFGTFDACLSDQQDQWAAYGRVVFIWIHNDVEHTCYEAAGLERAK